VRTTVGKRRKRKRLTAIPPSGLQGPFDASDEGNNPDGGDGEHLDSRGLTAAVRKALLCINPLLEGNGKRKTKSNVPRGARPPVLVLAESSRVRLLDKLAFYSGLIPGATGTVVGFIYSTDNSFGDPMP